MVYDVIINGTSRTGKDTFIDFVGDVLHGEVYVHNISSIDPFREIPIRFGWKGKKDDDYRTCLHLLKEASTYIDDFPTRFLLQERERVLQQGSFLKDTMIFYHIREPKEILSLMLRLPAVTTLLIKGSEEMGVLSSPSDAEVFQFNYDITISNRGTLSELKTQAKLFLAELKTIKGES